MRQRTFPQANSLNVMIDVLTFLYINGPLSDKDISSLIGYNERQGAYYTSTCYYFNLVDENNNLTDLAKSLFIDKVLQKNRLYAHIIQDPIFGDVFANYIFKTKENIKEYAEKLISKYFNYSEAVNKRRASTVETWVREIASYLETPTLL